MDALRLSPFLPIALSFLLPLAAHAQADFTATKTISLDVFAGATVLNPKYGSTTGEIGYLVGADITRHFRPVDVSFEVRYTAATGDSADETTYGGGLKIERAYHRFHPYVDFLVASGKIKFDHPEIYGNAFYTHDDSLVYDFGGGVDYDLNSRFALKADFQVQRWHTGIERPPFYPYNASLGIQYRIPFSNLRPHRH